jgi:hypothetical protein
MKICGSIWEFSLGLCFCSVVCFLVSVSCLLQGLPWATGISSPLGIKCPEKPGSSYPPRVAHSQYLTGSKCETPAPCYFYYFLLGQLSLLKFPWFQLSCPLRQILISPILVWLPNPPKTSSWSLYSMSSLRAASF